MTLDAFRQSLARSTCPQDLTDALRVLWHDARGDWDEAHRVAQDLDTRDGAHLHAYLHRKEGDETNAHYWYRRANVRPFAGSLDDEWTALVAQFLDDDTGM